MAESLKNSFLSFDRQLLDKSRAENWHDGTTALVALLAMTPAVSGEESRILITKPTLIGGRRKQGARRDSSESNSSLDSEKSASSMDEVLVTDDGTQNLTVYIANAGDCRAISVYGDGRVFQLSTDHTPLLPYERWRIFKSGGNIKLGRIEGKLSVSRGFGDRQFKEPRGLVSALPEVVSCLVTHNLRFLILACDGIWGWLSNTQVARFVSQSLSDGNKPEIVVKELVKYAFDQGSTDNISVVLLYFTLNSNDNHLKLAVLPSTTSSGNTASSVQSGAASSGSSESPLPGNIAHSPSATHIELHLTKSTPHKRRNSKHKTSPRALAQSADDFGLSATQQKSRSSLDTGPRSSSSYSVGKVEDLASLSPSSSQSSSSRLNLSSSSKSKKFNFPYAAAAAKWAYSFDMVDRRSDRAMVIKTHIPTGEFSLLDQAEYDSTASEVEALILDSRPSVEMPPSSISSSHARHRSHPQSHHRDVENSSSISNISEEAEDNRDTSDDSSTSSSSDSDAFVPEPKRSSSVRIPAPSAHSRQSSADSGPTKRSVRQASVPDDDEDALAYFGAAKSMSPPTRANSAVSRNSSRSSSKARRASYGDSDSESEDPEEALMRRRSFDDRPSQKSTSRPVGRISKPHSRNGSSTTTHNAKQSNGKTSSNKEEAESQPSSDAAKSPPIMKKKRIEPIVDDQLNEEEAIIHRRAASFDLERTSKKKKSRK